MKVLGLDTSSNACSVALFDTDLSDVIASEQVLIERGHAELIFAQVERVTSAGSTPLSAVDRFAVTTGPGTFTGVRIGLAAARGLALAAGKALIGLGSLEVIAAGGESEDGGAIAAAIDARRGELYVQCFLAGRALTEPFIASAEDAAARVLAGATQTKRVHTVGTGAAMLAQALAALGMRASTLQADSYPQASVLARLAAVRPQPSGRPTPLYLREPDAKPASHFRRQAAL